jgi:hypothetical protein
MDCEGALTKLTKPIYKPKNTMAMGTDMDLVMAWKQLQDDSKHTITTEWVMGHATEKKKNRSEITNMEWENEDCDDASNVRVKEDIQPEKFSPLPGYRAMLQSDGEWVTNHFRVRFANNTPDMVQYVMKRLSIDMATFNTINWHAVGRVRAGHKINRIVRTSKMMYRWLPVGHNWIKCNMDSH